jgi:hypothetical protein
MPNWKKVLVSGSDAALNSLNVTTTLVAPSITGSLFGTASWARNSLTASFFSGSIANAVSSSYALTASYAVNIQISGSVNNVQVINFATGSDQPVAEGRLGWDDGYGTLNLGLKGGNVNLAVGQELFVRAFNAEATTLTKGTVVYISGSQGNRVSIKRASAIAEAGSANTLGFVAEEILSGAEGFVQTEGPLNELNTLGLTAGGLVYLSSSAGLYTQTPPQAPLHSVRLGYVERVHATVGSIYVKIDNGYEIDELHDVLVTNPTNGDLLVRSGSLWLNTKQLTGSYGLTGSLNATLGFTGSLFGTASWASNAISASFAATSSNVLGGTTNYIPVWRGSTSLSSSIVYENDLKIGIGTTAPGSRLEVSSVTLGNSVAAFDAPSNGGVLSFKTSGTERANLFWRYTINQGTGGNYLLLSNNENGGNLALQTRTSGGVLNSNAIVIDSTGNVGIAVTSPSTKLHVSASTGGVLEVDGAGTAGANALYVSASGNVGIGTATPAARLTIAGENSGIALIGSANVGSNNYTGISLNGTLSLSNYNLLSSTTDLSLYINRPSGGTIRFREANGTEQVYIGSGGNVGIGTASPGSYLLNVAGNISLSGAAQYIDFQNGDLRLVNAGGLFSLQTYSVSTGLTTKMTVTGLGDVGIGTTSPAARLHVSASTGGVFEVDGAGTAGANALYVSASGNVGIGTGTPSIGKLHLNYDAVNNRAIRLQDQNGIFDIITSGNSQNHSFGIYDDTNAAYRLFIQPAGNVGIGTTSPLSPLHVVGSFRSVLTSLAGGDTLISAINGVSNGYRIQVDTSNNITYTWSTGTNATAMAISSSGNVGIGTTSPTTALDVNGTGRFTAVVETSTRTLKENILPYSTDLDKFKKLQTVSFNWKDTKK